MAAANEHSKSAVLVVDVQNGVVANAVDRDGVVERINQVVDKARAAGAPVVWIQHDDAELASGSEGWQLVPELEPADGEPLVFKNYRDSFEATTLEAELQSRGVDRLVVMGAQTDFCVRWTLHSALSKGYDTVLVGDAHTTDEHSPGAMPDGQGLIVHTNSVWASQTHPSASATVVNAADINF